MKKKVIAFLCALALLVGLLPAGTATVASAETTTQQYRVGYAIKDINPNADLDDLKIFLTGNSDDDTRLAEGIFDDNGNAADTNGDGIFTTATAITDSNNNTVIYITVDLIQGYDDLTNDVRALIVDELSDYGITEDRIMVSASHTHSGPNLLYLRRGYYSKKTVGGVTTYYGNDGTVIDQSLWIAYYNYIRDQIVSAAVAAMDDRADATMSKGTVDAKETTKALNYNNGNGYHMNAVRHYEVTDSAGRKYIIGSSANRLPYDKEYRPVEESDNDMHVLLFQFDNTNKQPVVFVNWRAHTTMNSGVDKTLISSDYVNGLRTTLNNVRSDTAPNGYRAAFFQGAAGNIVTAARDEVWSNGTKYGTNYTATDTTYKDWMNEVGTGADGTFVYGRMLAEIAQYCIEDSDNMQECTASAIRTHQMTFEGEKQTDDEGLYQAALNATSYPFSYTYDGKTYIVNSSSHASKIKERATASSAYANLELNVILLGDQVAFVTAPNELADKYYTYDDNEAVVKTEGGLISATVNNDWINLVDDATYGTPFVLGYSNGRKGYIGNWLDYITNSPEYTTKTGFAAGAESIYSPGTYESYTSRLAQGQGEALIAQYKTILDDLKFRVAECEACGETVEWTPIQNGDYDQNNSIGAGHYYLTEDITDTGLNGQWNIGDGSATHKTCIDLMGHDKTSASRNFIVNANATLNLMDSVGTSEVQGQTYSGISRGGNIYVHEDGTFNLYGGTLSLNKVEGVAGIGQGGVVYLYGAMTMYGGTVKGAEVTSNNTDITSNNGCGGAIYVRGSQGLNVYGGTIESGSVPTGGCGPCVFIHGRYADVTIGGNAAIDNIYFFNNDGTTFNVSGAYTGTASLTFNETNVTLAQGLDIGNCINNASLSGGNITCVDAQGTDYSVYIDGSDLKLSCITEDTSAVLYGSAGMISVHETLSDAISACSDGRYIKLMKNVSDPVEVSKNATIDLNGYNMSDVEVADGYTLYGMDSQTDDYTVKDNDGKLTGYGKITVSSGNVAGVTVGHDGIKDSYLMITENDGVSFHRVNLQLDSVNLRPFPNNEALPSIYYTSCFGGDEKVAAKVKSFGVALSVYDEPNAENMETKCKYSKFNTFASGENNKSTGTLLRGIMKETNSSTINIRNANMQIYGRAYVLLDDDTGDGTHYMFGQGVSYSLRQVIEAIDDMWTDPSANLSADDKENVVDLCETFDDVTKDWDIPNIRAYSADRS